MTDEEIDQFVQEFYGSEGEWDRFHCHETDKVIDRKMIRAALARFAPQPPAVHDPEAVERLVEAATRVRDEFFGYFGYLSVHGFPLTNEAQTVGDLDAVLAAVRSSATGRRVEGWAAMDGERPMIVLLDAEEARRWEPKNEIVPCTIILHPEPAKEGKP